MKSLYQSSNREMIRFILVSFLGWRIFIEIIARVQVPFLPIQQTFFGPVPWANFDGVHYIGIAERGYVQYEQAFFPLYSVLIRAISRLFSIDFAISGMIISNVAFLGSLFVLWKLVSYIPSLPKKSVRDIQQWTILFILAFPTSYYFASVYTESLSFFLILISFYFLQTKRFVFYGISAAVASGVRLVGSFLLVPVGLVGYMAYLWKQHGDPLLFMHVQPAFGANRSGDELIILPEVYYRYSAIFFRALMRWDPWAYVQAIALLEFVMFNAVLILLWVAWKRKYPAFWVYFSAASLILPTLTGTLSSMPRYVLVAFPLFIVLAQLPITWRRYAFAVCIVLLIMCTYLFTHGYWIA